MTAVSTDTDLVDPTVLAVRPQPLGAFPLPLGYMLIPASPETEEARLALLAGQVPQWPEALEPTVWRWPVTATARWRR